MLSRQGDGSVHDSVADPLTAVPGADEHARQQPHRLVLGPRPVPEKWMTRGAVAQVAGPGTAGTPPRPGYRRGRLGLPSGYRPWPSPRSGACYRRRTSGGEPCSAGAERHTPAVTGRTGRGEQLPERIDFSRSDGSRGDRRDHPRTLAPAHPLRLRRVQAIREPPPKPTGYRDPRCAVGRPSYRTPRRTAHVLVLQPRQEL